MLSLKKKAKQSINVLLLLIYLISSSSLFLLHNHDHHDLSFCKEGHQDLSCDVDCSHDSHITTSKEKCAICDYFVNYKPALLDYSIKYSVKLYITKRYELLGSFILNYSTNCLNKSPPLI